MKKKIIVIAAFSGLILITLIFSALCLMQIVSYYDCSNNEFDIGEAAGLLLFTIVGGIIVFYELDLFYTVYYFLIRTKTKIQSTLNILSHLTLIAVIARILALSFFSDSLLLFEEVPASPNDLFLIYIVLRIISFIVPIVIRFNKKK